jgi:two-component system LytT family response regulator
MRDEATNERIKTLIVDDEPLARRRLRSLAAADRRLAVISECEDGAEAIERIASVRPALVLLDVQMPELSGFDVWEAVMRSDEVPLVVFITAYDRFAVRAFEIGAVDYLLKPFDDVRFTVAIDRVSRALTAAELLGQHQDATRRALSAYRDAGAYLSRIAVSVNHRVVVIDACDLDWIEAADNYIHLHVGASVYRLRETLTSFAQKLDPAMFMRVHRWHVVNVTRIRELRRSAHGELVLGLEGGVTIRASRTFAPALRRLLGNRVPAR